MPMACVGVAAGADGVVIEVHHDSEHSVSDARQALSCEVFNNGVDSIVNLYHHRYMV